MHQHRLTMRGWDTTLGHNNNLVPIHALCRVQTFSQVCVQHARPRSALNSTIRTLFMFQVLLRCTSSATGGVKRCAVSTPPRAHAHPSSAPSRSFAGDRDARVIFVLSRRLARGLSLTSPAPRGRVDRRRVVSFDPYRDRCTFQRVRSLRSLRLTRTMIGAPCNMPPFV